jgi:hypothetical protein
MTLTMEISGPKTFFNLKKTYPKWTVTQKSKLRPNKSGHPGRQKSFSLKGRQKSFSLKGSGPKIKLFCQCNKCWMKISILNDAPVIRQNVRVKVDECRVARWFILIPKIPIWVNFGGPWNGKCWYVFWPFGIFYGHLVQFMAVWYMSGHLI